LAKATLYWKNLTRLDLGRARLMLADIKLSQEPKNQTRMQAEFSVWAIKYIHHKSFLSWSSSWTFRDKICGHRRVDEI